MQIAVTHPLPVQNGGHSAKKRVGAACACCVIIHIAGLQAALEKSCAGLCRSALSLAAIQPQAGLADAQQALASAAAVLASAAAQAAVDEVVHAAVQAAAQPFAEGFAESSGSQPQPSETLAQLAARLGADTDLQAGLLRSEVRVLQQVQFLDQSFRSISTGLAAALSSQPAAALSIC